MTTPAPKVLEGNMNSFLHRWQKAEYEGKLVVNAAALKQITNIKVHMKKGCLSGIKPGRGTNRNENLHKNLNAIMTASKYGVEYAYALLTLCFFKHNEKQLAKAEKRQYAYPIEYYISTVPRVQLPNPEHFGLHFASSAPDNIHPKQDCVAQADSPQLTLSSDYKVICARINAKTTACRAQGTCISEVSVVCHNSHVPEQAHDSEEETPFIAVSSVKQVLLKALSWFFMHRYITNNSETASLQIQTIPFINSAMGNLFNPLMEMAAEPSITAHKKRLDDVVASWNFRCTAVPADGNCLFHAVAVNLCSPRYKHTLQQMAQVVDMQHSPVNIATVLRQLVVDEWLGEHSNEYWGFIGSAEGLQRQATQFAKSGEFASDIGDLVLAALSNILNIPIVVFTSVENMPIIVQYPSYSSISTPDPIYLAYLQHGLGHYDAALPISENIDTPPVNGSIHTDTHATKTSGCSCGRKSGGGKACNFELHKYTCRCPCFNGGKACTSSCRCKNCMNPHGQKELAAKSKIGQKRTREQHESQSLPLRGTKTTIFMEAIGEPISIGGFSHFEFLLVCAIVQHFVQQDSWDTTESMDIHTICAMYTCAREFTTSVQIDLPLYERKEDQVLKLVKLQHFRWEVFHQRCSIATEHPQMSL